MPVVVPELNPALTTRLALKQDSGDIARIYNEGIDERIATFEVSHRKPSDIDLWFNAGRTVVVGSVEDKVVSFAVSFPYSERECYRGVTEFSIYVGKEFRYMGFGKPTLQKLIQECGSRGIWKLVSRVFPENTASRKMLKSMGFREVGIYEKHAKLDGVWKDAVIVEYIIKENIV